MSPLFSDTADQPEKTAQIDLSSENVLLVVIARVSSMFYNVEEALSLFA